MARDYKYWKTMMEQQQEPEEVVEEETDEGVIEQELYYPFELTEQMLFDYEDPANNREHLGDSYGEVLMKLYRSAKHWKQNLPSWLRRRLKDLSLL